MNTNTFTVSQSDVIMHHTQILISHIRNQLPSLLYLILGLQCLKNWRNLGIIMLRGLFSASLSSSSDESSQIFCSAPNEPWDTDIHREAVKSKTYRDNGGENETPSENTAFWKSSECTVQTLFSHEKSRQMPFLYTVSAHSFVASPGWDKFNIFITT